MMRSALLLTFALLPLATGCVTLAGDQLEAIEPPPTASSGMLEYTVGNFEFTLEGGKMVSSNKMGRTLSDELLQRWKDQGYIEDFAYVPSSRFSGDADYNLTLSGSQYGESSIAMQLLSGLTLLVLPYSVDTKYDIQYTLENGRTGDRFSAGVAESYETWVELLLVLAAPVSTRGMSDTMDRMSLHLYEQLRVQDAFGAPEADEHDAAGL